MAEPFPWIKSATGMPLSFKWMQGSQHYEIHSPKFASSKPEDLLLHCMEVKKS